MTTEFELSVDGSSENLLNAISLLAEHQVNLDTIATAKVDDKYVIKFLTGCEEECRRTFMKSDLPFKERKVLVVQMYNKPGQWMKAARALLSAGVVVETSYLSGQEGDKLRFVFGVDDYDGAKAVIGQIAEYSVD
ncbi:MAG: hypothetical protein JSV90_04180 [Methanobacteriota archaeon]|nr:MAG: hypothetical protein JSV90_04180 [Euryarchaeota archaeon]